jgi:hypothetical protein
MNNPREVTAFTAPREMPYSSAELETARVMAKARACRLMDALGDNGGEPVAASICTARLAATVRLAKPCSASACCFASPEKLPGKRLRNRWCW